MIASNVQPKVWSRLRKIKSSDKIGTAYLFSGSSGSGKEWLAVEFSKLINCETNNNDLCSSCSSCVKLSKLQHENLHCIFPMPSSSKSKIGADPIKALSSDDFDFYISSLEQKSKNPFHKVQIPNARRITIDSIRFLRKSIYLKSQAPGRKIVIIFEAHLLSEGAGESANALLKILEEPPNNTSIILVTDKKSKLPLTISSRCQNIVFPNISLESAREILESEGVDNSKSMQLAIFANGNMSLAKELLSKEIDEPILEGQKIINEMITLDKLAWNNTINNFSMLAFRNPKDFIFKINLAQMWINLAFKSKNAETLNVDDLILIDTFKKFNDKHPKANLYGINQLFEELVQALSRNLYMPLVMINLLISIQTFLKGKEPEVII